MSSWTYVNGYVTVIPPGNGQRAMDFVLGSVVDHLPRVTGSEGDMHVEIVRRSGKRCSSSHDELGQYSNLGDGTWSRHHFEEQDTYDLLLVGALRDRVYSETLREFVAWMNRLSKRVFVEDMLVRVSGWEREYVFNGAGAWEDNFGHWSWSKCGYGEFGEARETRHSTNWRYGIVPRDGNWTELLVNLVPGGLQLAHDMDYYAGQLEPYEYEHELVEYGKRCGDFADRMRENAQLLREYEAMCQREDLEED